MTDYRILETDQFRDDLENRLGARRDKILARLRDVIYPQLRVQPFFGRNIKKLRGYEPEMWRYRIGEFRLFHMIDDDRKVLFMIASDTRQGSYKRKLP